MIVTAQDIDSFEKLERVQFATTLPGAKPICLVGTIDSQGRTNAAPFSSVVHLGSNPPLLGMVTRPDTVERHTLSNILETKDYTLSHLNRSILERGHQCSARYDRDTSEFEATGLTEAYFENVKAPYVKESHIAIGLVLEDIIDIPTNGTKLIVGGVKTVYLQDGLLGTGGDLDISQSIASTALDTYFDLSNPTKLSYAKA